MSTQRVIAYGMHEAEIAAAHSALTNATGTESYVVGEIEEADIAALEHQGVIVERVAAPVGIEAAQTPAAARRGGPGAGAGLESFALPPTPAPTPAPEAGVETQWIMELLGPMLEEARERIAATGARLEERVPPSAYVVTATPEQAVELINLDGVADVQPYGPAVNGPVALTAGAARRGAAEEGGLEAAVLTVWDAWLVDAAARDALVAWCGAQGIEVVGSGGRKVRFSLFADSDRLPEVQALPGVLNVVEFVPPRLHNDLARVRLGVDADGEGHGGLPYSGAGQVVGVADTGLDDQHPDFQGRIVGLVARGRPGDPSDPHGHGTHVAGSVLGDGSASGGQFRGVAPEASLFFQSLLDAGGGLGGLPVALSELFQEAYDAGARVHNNSWGSATGSAYTIDSTEVDDFIASHRDMLVVISAGNEGSAAEPLNSSPGFVDWLSMGSPASCKNALTVGAHRSVRTSGGFADQPYSAVWPADFPMPPIADQTVSGDGQCIAGFSSRGPCDDRRIKPDVVAPGTDIVSARSGAGDPSNYWGTHQLPAYAYMGGTSMAAPLVAGCAALVRQYYVDERGIAPSAALLKATLINGTTWLSGEDALADFPLAPNYHQGFGAVNLLGSIPNASSPALRLELVDSWEKPVLQFARTGQRFRFEIDVQEVDPALPLRVTLTYTDLAARALQNDLSMLLQQPDGQKRLGNEDVPQGLKIPDPTNNVEVIRIDDAPAGTYTVQVFARNLLRGPQDFALVVTGALGGTLRRVPG